MEVKASIASGKFVTGLEVRWSSKNETVIEVEPTISSLYRQGGEQAGVLVIARDIIEIQRLRAAAAVEREKLPAAQVMAHVASVEHAMQTGETWHSDEFCQIFGLLPGQVVRSQRH